LDIGGQDRDPEQTKLGTSTYQNHENKNKAVQLQTKIDGQDREQAHTKIIKI
jgi:hypothetical protein